MLESILDGAVLEYRTQSGVQQAIEEACAAHPDLASFQMLGESEEGRPIYGVVLGTGPRTVSLIAGAHADEPAGPETLRTFILEGLRHADRLGDLFRRFRFIIIPHINPDGEARNRPWIERWPDFEAYLRDRVRELPGRDVEFGFPAMRAENRLVAAFMRAHAPLAIHMSLHGMGIAEGAMLLIERHWTFRTQALRDSFAAAAQAEGLILHDHNRKGEKGFFYIEPGFTTTPEGEAMRYYFRSLGDESSASLFHDSSMEFARILGGDPLCLVTELPLFVIRSPLPHTPGLPATYLAFRDRLPEIRKRLAGGKSIGAILGDVQYAPVPLADLVRIQLKTIAYALLALSA